MSDSFFDDPKNVESYVDMAAGYDGRELIALLRRHVPAGATVLELGMGPGVDLDILAETYTVTGSDFSQVFLDRYRETHPEADLLRLDAVTMDLPQGRHFDAIYSNKVLHHLTRDDLALSLAAQISALSPGGHMLHSFWAGAGEELHHGMRFTYWTAESLREVVAQIEGLSWVEDAVYEEMEAGDSLYVLLRAAS
jgi:SAM-dependent methyltransferase